MRFDPDLHHRRSIRLQDYDYSTAGAYFVTICTFERECLLGDVVHGEMRLNDAGQCVATIWDSLPERYPDVEVDAFVVMPNHIHGIIVINDDAQVGANHDPFKGYRLSENEYGETHQPITHQPRCAGVAT